MAILMKNWWNNEESHCCLWTEAAAPLLQRKMTGQMSKHWRLRRHLVVVLCITLILCAQMPYSVDACQQESLPEHCFWEYQDDYQPCHLTHTEKVGCIYAKINSTKGLSLLASEESEKFSSQPGGFAIKSYTSHFQSVLGCGHVFNISWKFPQDASFECLKGFLLDITFDHMGEPQRFLRHFDVETKGLTAMDLSKIVFYYDCFVPRPNTFFQIRLRSLPVAPFGMSNDVWQSLQTYDNEVDVDLNNTGNWKASIWVKSFGTISSSSLEICFTTAPVDFRFAKYNIYLLSSSNNPLRLIRYSAAVDVQQTDNAADACHTFDVCSDTYRIEIEPESDDGADCKCKLESKCVANCETSVFERADMTHSMSRCPVTPVVSPHLSVNPSASMIVDEGHPGTETPSKLEPRKIAGLVVGTFLGLMVFGVLGYLVWKKHRKPPTPDRKRVFILDSSDTRDFQPYVQFLADFLRRRSHCQVHILSDWLLTDTDDDSNLDRIWNRIVNADCTIFVMSDACRRHYRDVIMGVIRPPSGRDSVINNAVVAMIMQLMYSSDSEALRKKCFEVCLPGNVECHELSRTVRRSYRFLSMNDLAWEVRGAKQQPRFSQMKIGKLLERWKVKRDWKMNGGVAMCDRKAIMSGEVPLLKETAVPLECPVQMQGQDGGGSDSLNNNRDSFYDLNHIVETEGHHKRPLKSEVSKCDSGFSDCVVTDIIEMMMFQPPLSRTQSSSTLGSSVGHDGQSFLLFSSSYDFSNTSIDDANEA